MLGFYTFTGPWVISVSRPLEINQGPYYVKTKNVYVRLLAVKNCFSVQKKGKNEMKKSRKKNEPGVISEQNEQEFLTQMHYFSDWVSPFWALKYLRLNVRLLVIKKY